MRITSRPSAIPMRMRFRRSITEEGLNGLLSARHFDMQGIVNGIDYPVYDPETDPKIYVNYDAADFRKKNTSIR